MTEGRLNVVGLIVSDLERSVRLYRRLGFVSLGHGQTWWLHPPVLEAPPPPETQVRFVEAVGTGDVAALDEPSKGKQLASESAQLVKKVAELASTVAKRVELALSRA